MTINIDPADKRYDGGRVRHSQVRPEPRWWPLPGRGRLGLRPAGRAGGRLHLTDVEFATEGGTVTENITTAPGGDRAIVGNRAWIRTPAGLSSTGELVNPFALTNATAVITGTGGTFDLAQTCPASGATASPSLPVTGAAVSGPTLGKLTAVGGSLILVGFVLLRAQRRRRFVACRRP